VDGTSEDEFCGSLREEIFKNNKTKNEMTDLPMTHLNFLRWVSWSEHAKETIQPEKLERAHRTWRKSHLVQKQNKKKGWRKHTGWKHGETNLTPTTPDF